MINRRATMQDIADACGLSRNTVSKVFNQRGSVPQATRELILATAQELGYIASVKSPAPTSENKSIALLTRHMPVNYHFATLLFPAFTAQVSQSGYNLKMFEISNDELTQKRFPEHLSLSETAGLICIDLFDMDYMTMVCDQGLPVVSIDMPRPAITHPMNCDIISMENISGMATVMQHFFQQGITRIGFVGDHEHCCSFFERWLGYSISLIGSGFAVDEDLCILADDTCPYNDSVWLNEQLDRMGNLPEAFVCANDFLALHLIAALKKRGLSIPQDIMVAGFDDILQAELMEPSLTTVHIPSAEIGRIAANTLLNRINNPSSSYLTTTVRTTPVFRASTQRR